jgi:nucleoside-diphosphate-sugar epimerase
MTILITGSSSYIGINLIKFLKSEKKKYFGVDITKPADRNCIKLDILDKNFYKKIRKKKISSIVHLAAISNKSDCEKNIIKCYNTNLLGTISVINLANKLGVKKFIFASSEWVYDNCQKKNYFNSTTEIPLNFTNHYSFSKLLCENLILLNNINYVILRFGIIYGKRNPENFSAVESIIDQFLNKEKIIIQSKKTSRSFIHIDDIINSIYKSIINKNLKKIIDIQGPRLIALGQLIKILEKKLNKKVKIQELDKKNYSIRYISINRKEKINVLFKSKIKINEGIDKILNERN